MNWNLISQISTTVGAIVAALSILSGYQLYRKSKKDAYVDKINSLLLDFTNSCNEMDRYLDNELIHDMVYSIIYRDDFTDMLTVLINNISEKPDIISDDEKLEKFIKETLPSVTHPILSVICKQYDQLGKEIILKASFIKSDFPALYRLIISVNGLFSAISRNNKYLLHDDNVWEKMVAYVIKEEAPNYEINNFKSKLLLYFVGILHEKSKDAQDQEDINCMITIVKMIIPKYSVHINRNVYKTSRKEKSEKMKEDCPTLIEDFLEVEKVIKRFLLSPDEVLEYRTLITELKERNKN